MPGPSCEPRRPSWATGPVRSGFFRVKREQVLGQVKTETREEERGASSLSSFHIWRHLLVLNKNQDKAMHGQEFLQGFTS